MLPDAFSLKNTKIKIKNKILEFYINFIIIFFLLQLSAVRLLPPVVFHGFLNNVIAFEYTGCHLQNTHLPTFLGIPRTCFCFAGMTSERELQTVFPFAQIVLSATSVQEFTT